MLLCVFVVFLCFFFCFKQKTAYEMRISDWSSDVCSSDLAGRLRLATPSPACYPRRGGVRLFPPRRSAHVPEHADEDPLSPRPRNADDEARPARAEIGRASCRERVCQYV